MQSLSPNKQFKKALALILKIAVVGQLQLLLAKGALTDWVGQDLLIGNSGHAYTFINAQCYCTFNLVLV